MRRNELARKIACTLFFKIRFPEKTPYRPQQTIMQTVTIASLNFIRFTERNHLKH